MSKRHVRMVEHVLRRITVNVKVDSQANDVMVRDLKYHVKQTSKYNECYDKQYGRCLKIATIIVYSVPMTQRGRVKKP